MRLRLDVAYDGTAFRGWARQPGLRTVQGELEQALACVLRLPGASVTCGGRTDAGVHARGQVGHVDVPDQALAAAAGRAAGPPTEAVRRRLDGVLPADVRVRALAVADPGFDARFSALWRRYAYRIADDPAAVDPLARHQVVTWPRPLDPDRMNLAARALTGEHDFAAFCRPREGATTVRRLLELGLARGPDGVLVATVRADAFCHHMVRSLLGCLTAVGEGRRDPAWAGGVLRAGVRDPGVRVLPAHGLTLEEIAYPPREALAARAELTRVVRVRG